MAPFDPFQQVQRMQQARGGDGDAAPDWQKNYGEKLQSLRDQYLAQQDAVRSAWAVAQGLASSMGVGKAPRQPMGLAAAAIGAGMPRTPSQIQALAQRMAAERGWTGKEWDALYDLVNRESSWKHDAKNPNSSAYGLFQFIDSTWKNYGPKTSDPVKQIEYGLRYIADRYGTPSAALAHWLARKPINGRDVGHWY